MSRARTHLVQKSQHRLVARVAGGKLGQDLRSLGEGGAGQGQGGGGGVGVLGGRQLARSQPGVCMTGLGGGRVCTRA